MGSAVRPEDMPDEVRRMLKIRATGHADPRIPKYLQRPLVDRDTFEWSKLEGIVIPHVPIVETRVLEVTAGAFRVRLFAPHRDRPLPLVLHLHGGAFVIGNIDMPAVDAKCRQLCLDLECVVLTIDYRLAPEFKYPTQIEDALAALQWCHENAQTLGIDPARVAVMGESAGAGLAAALAMMVRDRGGPPLAAQVLEVPLVDLATPAAHQSYHQLASGFGLEAAALFGVNVPLYCSEMQRREPYASPLHAGDLAGLAPALVLVAEFDILRDSGKAYAERLMAAGVPTELYYGAGHNHGSISLFQTWSLARQWYDAMVQFLDGRLADVPSPPAETMHIDAPGVSEQN
jgi:acetyl esterase